MSAHTPGPWVSTDMVTPRNWTDRKMIGECVLVRTEEFAIADVRSDFCIAEEAKANARLIAAAPELLEALKAVLSADLYADSEGLVSFAYPNTDEGEAAAEIARRAIAKATQP